MNTVDLFMEPTTSKMSEERYNMIKYRNNEHVFQLKNSTNRFYNDKRKCISKEIYFFK